MTTSPIIFLLLVAGGLIVCVDSEDTCQKGDESCQQKEQSDKIVFGKNENIPPGWSRSFCNCTLMEVHAVLPRRLIAFLHDLSLPAKSLRNPASTDIQWSQPVLEGSCQDLATYGELGKNRIALWWLSMRNSVTNFIIDNQKL